MMLYGVFGGILYLLKAHSEKLAESRCGHGARRSDFCLTAALCTAYRCICFYQKPDNRRRSECLFYFSVAVSPLFLEIQHYGRQDSACTARGRGNYAAARGILFTHSVSIRANNAVFTSFGRFVNMVLPE